MDIVLNNISCIGTERSIVDCVGNRFFTMCYSMEDAAIICQGNYVIGDR